jgi:hypothetical protein
MQGACIVANGKRGNGGPLATMFYKRTADPQEWDSRPLFPGLTQQQLESAYAEGTVYKQQEQY